MIFDLLIDLVLALVGPLLDLLPAVDLTALTTSVSTGAAQVGGWAMLLNPVLPITELLALLGVVATLLPVIIAYKVFSWVWRHVPTVAGFGTGNG